MDAYFDEPWIQKSSEWSAEYLGNDKWEVTEVRVTKPEGLAPYTRTYIYWVYEDTGEVKRLNY
jgi:hypothetical protein